MTKWRSWTYYPTPWWLICSSPPTAPVSWSRRKTRRRSSPRKRSGSVQLLPSGGYRLRQQQVALLFHVWNLGLAPKPTLPGGIQEICTITALFWIVTVVDGVVSTAIGDVEGKIIIKVLWRWGEIIILELVNTPQIPGVSVLLHSLTPRVTVLDYINI